MLEPFSGQGTQPLPWSLPLFPADLTSYVDTRLPPGKNPHLPTYPGPCQVGSKWAGLEALLPVTPRTSPSLTSISESKNLFLATSSCLIPGPQIPLPSGNHWESHESWVFFPELSSIGSFTNALKLVHRPCLWLLSRGIWVRLLGLAKPNQYRQIIGSFPNVHFHLVLLTIQDTTLSVHRFLFYSGQGSSLESNNKNGTTINFHLIFAVYRVVASLYLICPSPEPRW